MDKLRHFGRLCFAVSIAFFGAQYLLYGHFEGGLPLVPPWTPGAPVLAYVLGMALILLALSIATLWKARYSAISLGTFLLLSFLFLHCLHASSILHNGTDRTRAFECLTLAAIAFSLAGILPNGRNSSAPGIATTWPLLLGRFLFAISMVVFGSEHFMYAGCIATGILESLASMGLGLMFLLWFLLLHAPRVAVSPRYGDEWTSAFVALAVSCGSFLLGSTFSKRPSI